MKNKPISQSKNTWQKFTSALGPSLLMAGAAIGVSHLVLSTRAGALYGMALLPIIVIAHITKYPALQFGSRYVAATGHSLLEAYRQQGKWTLVLVAMLTLGTMVTIEAAVVSVTGALLDSHILKPIGLEQLDGSLAVVVLCGLLLAIGGFSLLNKSMKVLLVTMALMTFAATVAAIPRLDLDSVQLWPQIDSWQQVSTLTFMVALAGWMPAPLDISIWNSLWAREANQLKGEKTYWNDASKDFHISFGLCLITAICFLILGTVVMHQQNEIPQKSGAAFANQLVYLFGDTLGEWSQSVVIICSIAVMFSTSLTVLDAFPRVLSSLAKRFQEPEPPHETQQQTHSQAYWISFFLITILALCLLWNFTMHFTTLILIATILSFLTTPAFAWLNHRAMWSKEVPQSIQPSKQMKIFSLCCTISLSCFAAAYLFLLIFYS